MPETPTSTAIFFRHLPKTAGTSLITTLSNVYGDGSCHRFHDISHGFRKRFDGMLQERGDTLSLITGHIPLMVIEDGACGTEFTLLREPIARLLSMRRFFEGLPSAERTRLGFGERVTVADLVTSRKPEIYGQVRNGLIRFFSGFPVFGQPDAPEYWETVPAASAVNACNAVLERMAVGTVENMPAALRRIGHVLRVPYDLETTIENATTDRDDDVSLEDIRALVEINAADIAVYHLARKRLSAWSPERGHVCGGDFDPRTLFDPQPGEQYAPQEIPGRQGFEMCSAHLCWLGPANRGRIHLAPSKRPLALSLVLYGVVPHYPMEDIRVTLDGRPWLRECRRGAGHSVFAIATIPPHANPLELTIVQPCSVPVPLVEPTSFDKRSLGTALVMVACEAA